MANGVPPVQFLTRIYKRVEEMIAAALRGHRVNLSGGDGVISGTLPSGNGGTGNGKGEALPKGPAGGDLGGSYPNPAVVAIQGIPVSETNPTVGQALIFDGSEYVPNDIEGGAGPGVGGVPTPPRAGLFLYSTGSSTGNYVWADILTENEDDGGIILDDDGSIMVSY